MGMIQVKVEIWRGLDMPKVVFPASHAARTGTYDQSQLMGPEEKLSGGFLEIILLTKRRMTRKNAQLPALGCVSLAATL